ncbi:MAG: hypothetical protein AB1847_03165 [bacterium]
MGTRSLQDEYLEKLSFKVQKLSLEISVFQARADKAVGLAKARYLEQMKNLQEKRELLNDLMKKIIEPGDQLDRIEFREEIDSQLKEVDRATDEDKQRLIDLFG